MPGTLTVTPVALTITADNKTTVYGASLPTLTTRCAGLVNGDTSASLTTQPTVTTSATLASQPGTYSITASGAVDPDYTISYAGGTVTVEKDATLATLSSLPSPSFVGQPVTFMFAVSAEMRRDRARPAARSFFGTAAPC